MSKPARDLHVSLEEYLEFEAIAEVRHEYVAGRVHAMVGATEAHNAIVSNLHLAIGSRLRGSGCRAYVSDMKILVESSNSIYYPDLVVTCEAFVSKSLFKTSPRLIVEVLSPSTADIDCREKLLAYKTIPSLREYIIVYQDERKIERFRNQDGEWEPQCCEGSGSLLLEISESIRFDLSLDEVYEGVIEASL